ncbi:zinc ribbon domain-containing protein [Arthrobacter sp. zg-Y1219]|uniref:FmdB family zinc ribbon protein n=1 Tax=Arthrobacter sp. zg-Y1219 TaxID=3049067 RepID=UPI0024C37603|nr:zinc ribbon domain-containing protein [Arthrobacter sp. zg-Y1219]MDK1359873.1 zinc ribbon domain-containing protein [Arthrobacter sp. zg-Y1219]
MPLYAYRCPDCSDHPAGSDFEASLAMGEAPGSLPCPVCGAPAPRRFTAPHLSRAYSSAYRLIESTQRSAAEPAVVRSPADGPRPAGPRPGGRRGNITTNPLHRKLPRPD